MRTFVFASCCVASAAGLGVGLVYTGIGVWTGKYAGELRPWLLAGVAFGGALPALSWGLYARGSYGAALVPAGLAVAGSVFFGAAVPAVLFGIANP